MTRTSNQPNLPLLTLAAVGACQPKCPCYRTCGCATPLRQLNMLPEVVAPFFEVGCRRRAQTTPKGRLSPAPHVSELDVDALSEGPRIGAVIALHTS
jgi:hypothetical protein